MSDDDDCKNFVASFLNFLKKQIAERNFSPDVIESIEVASQCLEAAYDLPLPPPVDAAAGPAVAVNGTGAGEVAATAPEPPAVASKQPRPDVDLFEMFQAACVEVLPDRQERAEEVKNEGNRLMKDSKFNEALLAYNKAIMLDATNATIYCNRAAAHIRLNDYEKSVADCKMALLYNPSYSKAYGRMGIAYSYLRKYEESCEAYRKALELEPNNLDYQNNLRNTQQQIENVGQQILDQITVDNPDLRNLVMEMVSDPMITMASRHVASRMANQFPEVLTGFQRQLGTGFQRQLGSFFDSDIILPSQMQQLARDGSGGDRPISDGQAGGTTDGGDGSNAPTAPPPPPPSNDQQQQPGGNNDGQG